MHWLSSPWKLLLMVAPATILFSAFIVYPVFYSVYFSLTDMRGFRQPTFVGLDNYAALAQDNIFMKAVGNTAIILVIAICVLIPLAFFLAMLLNSKVRASGMARALVFTPNIVAPILVGLIWVFILDPKLGLINMFLRRLGSDWQPQWIGGESLTPYSIALVYIWATVGFTMTIFYAGLQVLPGDVLEASSIDGATRWQQTRHIVIPMMRQTFAIVAVLVFTGALRIFELVFMLTGGGPVHASEVLVSYMYYVTFTLQQYGSGMAIAVVITALGALGSVGYVLMLRERKPA